MLNTKLTFRFDDVSINTDATKLSAMVGFLRQRFEGHDMKIIFAVSPLVHILNSDESQERVFPKMLHVESDFREFYLAARAGLPKCMDLADEVASHGLIHVDHRLLTRSAQEMSIMVSCSLLRSYVFVPPFHKWNKKTEEICQEHKIELVKHIGWEQHHLLYHQFQPGIEYYYYLHTHDFPTYDAFVARFPQ